MMHMGGGWWSYMRPDADQSQPKVSRDLLRRVAQYARPYRGRIAIMLLTMLGTSYRVTAADPVKLTLGSWDDENGNKRHIAVLQDFTWESHVPGSARCSRRSTSRICGITAAPCRRGSFSR